jgi:exodeoxyribonuclease VII large subunit
MTDYPEPRITSTVLPVSRLVASARLILERNLPLCWVSGEISNFSRAPSGHCYFILKDDKAQVRCVFFRSKAQHIDFALRDGVQVEVRALASLYEARGEFQLTVEAMRLAGLGALFEAFARLKAKLADQGWFDAERKRALPAFPKRIGVVTSPRAAALHDVLTTLKRRMPAIPVVVYPCGVQGREAWDDIVRALRIANRRRECDVLIVCRGGGSIEDLWAFNEEAVARAVLESEIPVVSGVGHETDFTICDFVADVRAATPTAAATLIVPDRHELDARVRGAFLRVRSCALRLLEQRMQQVDHLGNRLRHPAARLAEQQRLLARQGARLAHAWRRVQDRAEMRLLPLQSRLLRHLSTPLQQTVGLEQVRVALARAAENLLFDRTQRLARCERSLALLNPIAVLERGYSIALTAEGSIVQSSAQLSRGMPLRLRFASGGAVVKVERAEPPESQMQLFD